MQKCSKNRATLREIHLSGVQAEYEVILRRLRFVLDELRSKSPTYDQSISGVLRALSNLASVGVDKSSYQMKLINPRISEAAYKLRNDLKNDKEWASCTINEHPVPLHSLWSSWLVRQSSLNELSVWIDLETYPMVTITKIEDAKLRRFRPLNVPFKFERYASTNIKVFNLDRNRRELSASGAL